MRILAIRGRNLASLSGDFAIDFTAEPLAGSGIFAITGPTGAGKSTLLDAVCLALFNEVPRLRVAPASGKIGVDEDSGLSIRDTRAILRHGAGDGFAEVDFAMPGGARYRARWSVRRARGRPDGRMQHNDHAFERLDTGERLGGTRTETTDAIQRVVGLTVEQFGRAVLLAQGDFEAFIRADSDVRALLLERLTGSEIYTRLGKAAFEKGRAFERELETLRDRLSEMNGLDDDQRAKAEAEAKAARDAEELANAERERLAAARRWEDRATELADDVTKAGEALDARHRDQAEAAPRREALARSRRALALAPSWSALAGAKDRHGNAEQAVGDATVAVAAAQQAEREAAEQETGAAAALAELEARQAALAPDLAAARALDVRIDGAKQNCDAAAAALQDAHNQLRLREKDLEAARNAHAEVSTRLGEATAWLEANPALEPLAQREGELVADLGRYREFKTALTESETRRVELAGLEQKSLAAWNSAQTRLEAASADHEQGRQALAAAEGKAPASGELGRLSAEQGQLAHVGTLLAEHTRRRDAQTVADSALARTLEAIAEAESRREHLEAQRAELTLRLPPLVGRLAEGRKELALLRAAADDTAEALRATLSPGEPCPVCGSAEHQLGVFEGKLGAHLREREAALTALSAEHDALAEQARTVAAQLEAAFGTRERLVGEQRGQVDTLDTAIRRLAEAFATLVDAARGASLPEEPATLETALAERKAQNEQALTGLSAATDALNTAREAEAAARGIVDTARDDLQAAADVLNAAKRALDDLDRTIQQQRGGAANTAAALDRLLGAVGDWRADADPARWLGALVASWKARHGEARDLREALPPLRDAETRCNAALESARARLAELEKGAAEAQAALAALQGQREALLDGEAVATVEEQFGQARATALETVDAARTHRATAANQRAAAGAGETQCRKQLTEAASTLGSCDAAFTAALAESGLIADEVAAVCAAGEAALEAEREALDLLDRAVTTAIALLGESQRLHARHLATSRPVAEIEDLAAALASAEIACAEASEHRAAADLVIREDDKVRGRTADLRRELEAKLTEADVWLKLKSLIGDREGAIFRRFAQGLTLDRLLDHANARLADLKPRYTLQRAPGGDMLVQVLDNDMGGEIRGLHNLSGGERFLVSLALALGLAEMSTASGVKIESLFIDEGFGALDPASLGQAIALLEHLHATGRRVGVISHVEELKERIAVKIEVTPTGRGTSRIEVVGG